MVRPIGPRLEKLLWTVLLLAALMVANSVYLVSITVLEAVSGGLYESYFYQLMFLGHVVLGLLLIGPFVLFGIAHIANTYDRRNRRAVRAGYGVLSLSLIVLGTGLLLLRIGWFELKDPAVRSAVYWLHILCPLVVLWLYWLHRLVGRPIRWRVAVWLAAAVTVFVFVMIALHSHDPRRQVAADSTAEGFAPSLARTATGHHFPAPALMMDHYCLECHADVHRSWSHSAHKLASFNNPAYLASVRATRAALLARDGNDRGVRFCAGCHDPVPLLSGALDAPDFDDVRHPTAHAGITCTVCHAITQINSSRGNGDYTIEQPQHYPFAFSHNRVLAWINTQLVKAKPALHKRTYLKPLHQSAEFCSVCHKVHLPEELNNYKWLRGQNSYDSFLLSGVSGHGARSFYYPEVAQPNCNQCHMPLQESADFGAKPFDGSGVLQVHDHLFPSANTALAYWNHWPDVVRQHERFNRGVMRVDIFGLRHGGTIDSRQTAPLRPHLPTLQPGGRYLLEVVIRTLKLGHHFTQGTTDSNQIWLDVSATSGGQVIGRSGGMDAAGRVDPWAHFANVFMLDRAGRRIARRNPEDIFVALYDHQIPPGAAATVQYLLQVPAEVHAAVTITVNLRYRKFDTDYLDFIARKARPGDLPIRDLVPGERLVNRLPVMTLARDQITFPLAGATDVPPQSSPDIAAWQRWNDYGIGFLRKGTAALRQAAEAFVQVERLGRGDGPLNLARVLFREGRIDAAVTAINRAAKHDDPPPPPWTVAWLTGQINRQQGQLEAAAENFRSVVADDTPERRRRGFDFGRDYVVLNLLGQTLFDRAKQLRGAAHAAAREANLREAVAVFHQVLAIDCENVTAHYNLQLLYTRLGDRAKSQQHARLHAKYKIDDNARDRAVAAARQRYPAANHAAEPIAIYPLNRPGAPGRGVE